MDFDNSGVEKEGLGTTSGWATKPFWAAVVPIRREAAVSCLEVFDIKDS